MPSVSKVDCPRNIDEYIEWLRQRHSIDISPRTERYCESVFSTLKTSFEKSDLWQSLTANLDCFSQEYRVQEGYDLLPGLFKPELQIKPYVSFLHKTFRRNVLQNHNFPNEPFRGWVLPNNWFSQIHDIVRCRFVVKYLDGVDFLTQKIQELAGQCAESCTTSYEVKDQGYYAVHMDLMHRFEIPRSDWDTEIIESWCEIQITTQVQDLIRLLLHEQYEVDRQLLPISSNKRWQWEYRSETFRLNYLGHIMHYLEGMIMDVRTHQKGKANG